MRNLLWLPAFLVATWAGAARADDFNVDAAHSKVTYHLVHKLHEINGVSKKVEGKARLVDGKAQIMLRVPVQSFDSGNVNRDEHMKEVTEAAKFPTVEVKALGEGIAAPASFPSKSEAKLKAQVSFHGVQQMMDIPVTLSWTSPTHVDAETKFAISLDGFKVERPSLMFVKVDDALQLTAELSLNK